MSSFDQEKLAEQLIKARQVLDRQLQIISLH
jgi:hypothetical protein